MVDDGFDAALAELEKLPIVSSAKPLNGARGGVVARLSCTATDCPLKTKARSKSEQRQISDENDTLTKCATSLLELLRTKHATCIAEAQAAADSAAAGAEFDQSFLGTMMRRARADAEQRKLDEEIEQKKAELKEAVARAEAAELIIFIRLKFTLNYLIFG